MRAPKDRNWCSTRVYVMVYQQHENTGMSKQHVSQNNGNCTDHNAVGGVIQRQSDTVNNNEEDTCDETSTRSRPEAQQSLTVDMSLNNVHKAIVQIDGGDEMDTEKPIQYDTIVSVTLPLNLKIHVVTRMRHNKILAGCQGKM